LLSCVTLHDVFIQLSLSESREKNVHMII